MPNPFIYGNPIEPSQCFGRKSIKQLIFGRIHNAESTAIVGAPRIGKTTILLYINDKKSRSEWLQNPSQYSTEYIDCNTLSADYMPAEFWQHRLRCLAKTWNDKEMQNDGDNICSGKLFGSDLVDFFSKNLRDKQRRHILLLDDFERLFQHPNFFTAAFTGILRGLTSVNRGLILVIASRVDLGYLQELSRTLVAKDGRASSPVGHLIQVVPPPLKDSEIKNLIERSMHNEPFMFDERDRSYVQGASGGYPYLVQAAAGALYQTITSDIRSSPEKYQQAEQLLQESVHAHFKEYWDHCDRPTQLAFVALALDQLHGETNGRLFNIKDLSVKPFHEKLQQLKAAGLAMQIVGSRTEGDDKQDGIWRIASSSFLIWIISNIIPQTRSDEDWKVWLKDREYDGLLTEGQKKLVKDLWTKIPQSVISTLASLITEVVKQNIGGGDRSVKPNK